MISTYARQPSAMLAALTIAALAGAGCHRGQQAPPPGSARTVVLCDVASVTKVTVKVSPGDGPAFTPITAELTKSNGQWLGRVSGIPAGVKRLFEATALDANGAAVLSGSARTDVEAGAVAVVTIALNGAQPPTSENAFPVIDSLAWSRDQVVPGGLVQVTAVAHDPDAGDAVSYRWEADCGSFGDATKSAATWTAPPAEGICHLSIAVSDTHGATTRIAFSIDVSRSSGGADVTVVINSWPIISSLGGTVTLGASTMEGDLKVTAVDPDGDPLSYAWSSDCAGLAFSTAAPYSPVAPHFTLPIPPASCTVTVTVSDGKVTGGTLAKVHLPPGVPAQRCQNVTCQTGQACDPADGLCKANPDKCAGVTCSASDRCHVAGTCVATTGACSAETAVSCPAGQACAPATGQCTSSCVPACTAKTCGADACGGTCGTCLTGQTCDASGQCASVCTPACTGKSCGSDGCGGTCGTCGTGQTCSAAGACVGTCTPACTGKTCGSDGCGGTCGTCGTGQTCSPAGACVAACTPACTGKGCGSDGCGGTCGTCTSGQTCSAAGACLGATTGVVPVAARDLQISPPAGLAMDVTGNTYLAGNIFTNVDVNFQTRPAPAPAINLASLGGIDIFLAKYDTAGNITWAVGIADDDSVNFTNDQTATGAAVTADGKLAFVGKITGGVTFGASTVGPATPTPYLAAVSTVDGSRLWAKTYSLGSNGLFQAVASNPNQASNRIAVCGLASSAATQLVPGATFGGVTDLIVAVFDSAGTKLWATQLGGSGNEACDAVTIDDSGDVVAAGRFDGASLTFPGAAPITLTGPGTTARKFMWVARFAGAGNGSGGASTKQALAYSGTLGQTYPRSLAVAPNGDVVVGGNFSGNLAIGTTLTSGGSDDAFVARLGATSLAPVWAVRLGGSAIDVVKGVATTSTGDVVAVGTFNPSSATFKAANGGADTSGAALLTTSGTAAPDIFVLKLAGATGATDGAKSYGDAGTQNGDAVVANRFGADQVTFGVTFTGAAAFGPAGTVTGGGAIDEVLVFSRFQ